MAMTTTYLTVNGKIRSEQRAGEAHSRDYVLDPLGSVIQIYQNGWPIADACYEPYGGIYTQWNMEGKTFTWLGGWGYRQTGVEWSSVYVRARHYSRGLSNWTSIDPLWPSEMAYGYVEGRVMTASDPSGRNTKRKGKCGVWKCAQWGWGKKYGHWPTHVFLCITGPNNGCSGGLYPGNPGTVGDIDESCDQIQDKGFLVECWEVSNRIPEVDKCEIASAFCECIRLFRKNPPSYEPTTCYGFPAVVGDCVVTRLTKSRQKAWVFDMLNSSKL